MIILEKIKTNVIKTQPVWKKTPGLTGLQASPSQIMHSNRFWPVSRMNRPVPYKTTRFSPNHPVQNKTGRFCTKTPRTPKNS